MVGALLFSHSALPQETPVAADANSQELAGTIDEYVAAYGSGEVDRVMSYWAENSDFVDIRGRFHEGRDLIGALFRRGFADNPGLTLQLNSVSRKFLSPQVAMDDGILQLTSAAGEMVRGRYTVVWIKVNGKWLIRSARDIPIEIEESLDKLQTPPLQELEWLVGEWEAKTDRYQIELDCDWALEKNFLVQTFHVKSNEEDFRVVTCVGFDPAEAQFRSWFIDSRGGFGGGLWTRRDDTYSVASGMVMPDGRLGTSVMTWNQIDADTLAWQALERVVDGESYPDTTQSYKRVE